MASNKLRQGIWQQLFFTFWWVLHLSMWSSAYVVPLLNLFSSRPVGSCSLLTLEKSCLPPNLWFCSLKIQTHKRIWPMIRAVQRLIEANRSDDRLVSLQRQRHMLDKSFLFQAPASNDWIWARVFLPLSQLASKSPNQKCNPFQNEPARQWFYRWDHFTMAIHWSGCKESTMIVPWLDDIWLLLRQPLSRKWMQESWSLVRRSVYLASNSSQSCPNIKVTAELWKKFDNGFMSAEVSFLKS